VTYVVDTSWCAERRYEQLASNWTVAAFEQADKTELSLLEVERLILNAESVFLSALFFVVLPCLLFRFSERPIF
jgi:hypothetical protein